MGVDKETFSLSNIILRLPRNKVFGSVDLKPSETVYELPAAEVKHQMADKGFCVSDPLVQQRIQKVEDAFREKVRIIEACRTYVGRLQGCN